MSELKETQKEKIEEMQNYIVLLNQASKAYYQESKEIMTNHEYDALYDKLVSLEKESGITLSKSPTVTVGYEVLSDLPKETHPSKMLSLDKTKEVEQLVSWLGSNTGVMSWKLDGLTIVVTYDEGKMIKAVTRGNGTVGEVVTSNAKMFTNLPITIGFKGHLVIRGEAVISYPDFERINENISDEDAKYKNPRNLCAGSVRQLDSRITAERFVRLYAFSLVSAEGLDFKTRISEFEWLSQQGFAVVEHKTVTSADLADTVKWFENSIKDNIIPSDGLVLSYDDIEYGRSLGTTAKFPRDSIAFKWQDEEKETILKEIEWSPSRTGLINPVAIFEPVELEGTTVSRASVHNLSVMKELKLGIGDRIKVYKANMIIPQILENLTGSCSIIIPESCPVCKGKTEIKNENGVETLICPNKDCLAKQIKSFTLFVSRDAMNIDGLSEMTIEKLIAKGLIKEMADLFHVERFKKEITEMEGFGEKSFENLKKSIEEARSTTPAKFLYSLGIPNIGTANAALIAKHCQNKWSRIAGLSKEELVKIDGIGQVMADGYVSFFDDLTRKKMIEDLLAEINLNEDFEESKEFFKGITFVITGSLEHYSNREELKELIEKAGGKVAGSVSTKTTYLVNNDLLSNSSKNKKAKELGVKIIDEETVKTWIEAGEIKENA